MAPSPLVTSCDGCRLFLLVFKHPNSIRNCLWPLVESTESVRIHHAIRFGQLDEIFLAEDESIVALKLVVLWHNVFSSGFPFLLPRGEI